MAGATAMKGFMGFGCKRHMHTAKILRLSEDLPIIVEIVDSEEKINKKNFEKKTKGFVNDLKFNWPKIEECRNNPAITQRVLKDKQEVENVGVKGTPAFVVNGRMLNSNSYEYLKLIIDEKLKETK